MGTLCSVHLQWLTSWPANLHLTQRAFLHSRLPFSTSPPHEPEHEESHPTVTSTARRKFAQSPSSRSWLLHHTGKLSFCEILGISTLGSLIKLTGFYVPVSHLEHEGKPFIRFPKNVYLQFISLEFKRQKPRRWRYGFALQEDSSSIPIIHDRLQL